MQRIRPAAKTVIRRAVKVAFSAFPFLERAAAEATSELPSRWLFIEQLVTSGDPAHRTDAWKTFRAVGEVLNVKEVSVRGPLGEVRGLLADEVILAAYAEGRSWASEVIDELRRPLMKDGGLFVDVGANIGLVTLAMANLQNVRCWAFEPEPANFRLLSENVHRQGSEANVTLLKDAVFDSSGPLVLELADQNLGDHRVRTQSVPGMFREAERAAIEVQSVRLDDFPELAQAEGPLVVKIDTQGAEAHVIRGGTETLSKASLVVLEYWPYGLHRMGGDLATIASFAETFPWAALVRGDSDERPVWRPTEAVVPEVLRRWDPSTSSYWDLYLSREVSLR